VVELCSYNSGIAVWSRHLAPNNSDIASLSLLCCFVNERDSFAEIEPVRGQLSLASLSGSVFLLCGLGVIHAFDFDE
jgi:hypothetical protein